MRLAMIRTRTKRAQNNFLHKRHARAIHRCNIRPNQECYQQFLYCEHQVDWCKWRLHFRRYNHLPTLIFSMSINHLFTECVAGINITQSRSWSSRTESGWVGDVIASTQPIYNISIRFTPLPVSLYGLTRQSDGTYTLPSYVTGAGITTIQFSQSFYSLSFVS